MKYDRHSEIWIIFHTSPRKWWVKSVGYKADSYQNATPVSWQKLIDGHLVDTDNPIKLPLIIMLHPRVAVKMAYAPSITIDLD